MLKIDFRWMSVVLLCFAAVAAADDHQARASENVAQATRAFYAALNNGDAVAADQYLLPGGDSFPRTGKELSTEPPTQELSLKALRQSFASGLKFDVKLKDLQVHVFGDAAIATFYSVGSTSLKGEFVSNGTYRATYVWVNLNGAWKIAHFHLSALSP